MPRNFSPKTLLKQQIKAVGAEKEKHLKMIEHHTNEANKAKVLALNHAKMLAQRHGIKPGHSNYNKQVGEFAIHHPAWQKFKSNNDKVKQLESKVEEFRNHTIKLNKDLQAMTTKKVKAEDIMNQHLAKYNEHSALAKAHAMQAENMTTVVANTAYKSKQKRQREANIQKIHVELADRHNKLAQQALAQANSPNADVIITANKTIYNLHNELIEANTLLCDEQYINAIKYVQAADKFDNPADRFTSLQYKQKANAFAELLKYHQSSADRIASDLVIEARIKKDAPSKPLDKQTIQKYLQNYKDLVKQHTNLAKLHQRYAKDADKIRSSYNRMLYNQHVDMAKFHQTQATAVTQHSKQFYINANEYLMAKESKADKFAKVIKYIPAIAGDNQPIKITAGTKNKLAHHKKRYEYHRKHAVINLIKATRYANKKTAKQFGVPVSTAKQKIHHSQESEFVKAYKEHFNNCKACDRMHKHAEKCKNCQAKIAHYESKAAKKGHKSHATSNNFIAALNELVASANKD